MIRAYFGRHTTSPLHNPRALLPYVMDCRLALALRGGSGKAEIDEELERQAEEYETLAQAVAEWVSSIGLDVEEVKQVRASIRHYDLKSLKESLEVVRATVESVKQRGLMKKEISEDQDLQILLVAARLSVERGETAVLLSRTQL